MGQSKCQIGKGLPRPWMYRWHRTISVNNGDVTTTPRYHISRGPEIWLGNQYKMNPDWKLPKTILYLKLGNTDIKQIEEFVYWGRNYNSNTGTKKEIKQRISLAVTTFTSLNRDLGITGTSNATPSSISTRQQSYQPTFLYGSETYAPKKADERKLDSFDAWWLRKIMKVCLWQFKWNKA